MWITADRPFKVRQRLLDEMSRAMSMYNVDASTVLVIDEIRQGNNGAVTYVARAADGSPINLIFRPWEIKREVKRK